ncbi:MAG: ATP-binding protein [Calditrichaeota bacterium]|nr:MAG: ATP-binding protein [Calditrichota bacterium]
MVRISEINLQNPWWARGEEFVRHDLHLQRAQPIFFRRKPISLEPGQIYLLRGPRQVGKTTYVKALIHQLLAGGVPPRDVLYLSLDFFTSRRELRNAITHFLDTRRESPRFYLFLDEVTYLNDWNLELKFLADQGWLRRGVVLATGSSAIRLKEKGELLPGRGVEGNEYYAKPLSFREFILQCAGYLAEHQPEEAFADDLRHLQSTLRSLPPESAFTQTFYEQVEEILPFKRELAYLFRLYLIGGGMPGVINHYLNNRYEKGFDHVDSLVAETYIRDILGDLNRLQRQEAIGRQLLRAIMDRYGSRYSLSRLSREMERSHITIAQYLEYMEESFICFVLYPYDFNNKRPRLKGDKKVYFFDPFIQHAVRSYLSGIDVWNCIEHVLDDEEMLSKVVEGVVIAHLRMWQEIPYLRTGNTFLWFYYDASGREIDAILRENEEYWGIQVKFQMQVDRRDLRRIAPVKRYLLLSREEVELGQEGLVLPTDVFLSLLPVSGRNI